MCQEGGAGTDCVRNSEGVGGAGTDCVRNSEGVGGAGTDVSETQKVWEEQAPTVLHADGLRQIIFVLP
jgi:hypothetical protein